MAFIDVASPLSIDSTSLAIGAICNGVHVGTVTYKTNQRHHFAIITAFRILMVHMLLCSDYASQSRLLLNSFFQNTKNSPEEITNDSFSAWQCNTIPPSTMSQKRSEDLFYRALKSDQPLGVFPLNTVSLRYSRECH